MRKLAIVMSVMGLGMIFGWRAQGQEIAGSIRGTVMDESGGTDLQSLASR